MKTLIKSFFLISIFQLTILSVNAQNLPDSTKQKISGFRSFYEKLGTSYAPDSTVKVRETTVAGVKSYWFNERQPSSQKIAIYLHGGVYTYGSFLAYRAMLTHLSKALDMPLLYVEYSLSPEHPFPAANNEILKIYGELIRKCPGYQIDVIGDSAGGGLAITLVSDAQSAKLPSPAVLALISPWIDLKCENGSYTTKQAVDPALNRKFLYEHAEWYAGNNMKAADPSERKFNKFPPVLLLVGSDEVLNDDARKFYSYIKPIQKNSRFEEYQGQKHVWLFSNIDSKPSIEAMTDIHTFLWRNK